MENRVELLERWVRRKLDLDVNGTDLGFRMVQISGDASFRRYFRVFRGSSTLVAVDAPPDRENSKPFVDVAELLGQNGLNVPRVHHSDFSLGFMLVSDLGDDLYLDAIEDESRIDGLYSDALDGLVSMQAIDQGVGALPRYDRDLLLKEMSLFPDWFVSRQLELPLGNEERSLMADAFELLISSALSQPQTLVHRDYHSRNLLVTRDNNPGILDFQDAVRGAVTYDVVSLLRDCYVEWPRERLLGWLQDFLEKSQREEGALAGVTFEQFERWFDLMGLQRHIKVAGIFSRLHLRDGKELYLTDIPLVMKYILDVCARYEELADFLRWLQSCVLPAMANREHLFGALK